jgi:predicted NUDIX family phosphoesterase
MTARKRMILATAAERLSDRFSGTGFHPSRGLEAVDAFHEAGLWIGPRETLEEDPSFRQIIPYIILKHGHDFVRYTRTPSGGEDRLHGRMSIGLGGHIDIPDIVCAGESIDLEETIHRATERELLEELGDIHVLDREWIGVLTDDDTEVGRVHIGVVAVWHLRAPPVERAEDAIGDVALCSLAELEAVSNRLESWSAMLLPHLAVKEAKVAA